MSAATSSPGLLQSAAQIGRFGLLGTTFIIVLLGVASTGETAMGWRVALVLASAVAYHVAVYGWNDVVDLPFDRTEPRRARSPLVRGTIGRGTVGSLASATALAALVLAVLCDPGAVPWMGSALALLLVYDIFGKRVRISPLIDVVQGLGWAALVGFGASSVASPNRTTAWVAAYAGLTVVLVNGVHGGLRDLPNDARHGARTTAVLFGAVPTPGGGASVTTPLVAYAVALHIGETALLALGLADTGGTRVWTKIALGLAGSFVCLALLAFGLSRADEPSVSWKAGFAYIVLILTLPVLLVADHIDRLFGLLFAVLYLVPWAVIGWLRWDRSP